MTTQHLPLLLIVVVFLVFNSLQASAITDPQDVVVLQDLYKELNYPPQLDKWRSDVGDPCGESWKGVSCSGSSVISIQLPGLNLGGHLGGQLHNLHNLMQLIQGEIPCRLPPNATHLNLVCNKFSQNILHSLTSMKNIGYLSLSHNSLCGPIGNVLTGLQNLKEMNIQSNDFSGIIPTQFQSIPNLCLVGGNRFHPGGDDLPLVENEQNVTESSVGRTVLMIFTGLSLFLHSVSILILTVVHYQERVRKRKSLESSESPVRHRLPTTMVVHVYVVHVSATDN